MSGWVHSAECAVRFFEKERDIRVSRCQPKEKESRTATNHTIGGAIFIPTGKCFLQSRERGKAVLQSDKIYLLAVTSGNPVVNLMKRGFHLLWFPVFLLAFSLYYNASAAPSPAPPNNKIVIGFVGGFVRHDASAHREVQLASTLRHDYPGVHVEIFANHSEHQAHDRILQLLDSDRNGKLSSGEKNNAQIVLYGHSWGASEAVSTARTLQKDGIPVLLTVQVDSVRKFGEDDRWIPANVVAAVNFFQLDGILHGESRIEAADPGHTKILGNFQSDYKTNSINLNGYPWYARVFMKPHIEIESDPGVWNQVESLIRARLD